jgi:hypothetical protein
MTPEEVSPPPHGASFAPGPPGPPSFPGVSSCATPVPHPQTPGTVAPGHHGVDSMMTAQIPRSGYSSPAPLHARQQHLQTPPHALPAGLPFYSGSHQGAAFGLGPFSLGFPAQLAAPSPFPSPLQTNPLVVPGHVDRPFSLFQYSPIHIRDSQQPSTPQLLVTSQLPLYHLWGDTHFSNMEKPHQSTVGCAPSFQPV